MLATASLLPIAALSETPKIGDEIIFGRQGEGCACSADTKTSKPYKLFKEMSETWKVIGEYRKPVKAATGDAFSLVKDPGMHKITALTGSGHGFKVGDTIDRLFRTERGFVRQIVMERKSSFRKLSRCHGKQSYQP